MWYQRTVVLSAFALLTLLGTASPSAAADAGDIKIRGFAGVPGTSLTLPLPSGAAPVIVEVTFGVPSVTIPVQVTSDTKITGKSRSGAVVVTDGDAVKVRAALVGNVLRASRLELEDFPELELTGLAKGLPAAGATLPLAAGATLDCVVTLGASGVDVPVRLTSSTKLDEKPTTIHNGDLLRVEAAVRGGRIVVTKLKTGEEEDD